MSWLQVLKRKAPKLLTLELRQNIISLLRDNKSRTVAQIVEELELEWKYLSTITQWLKKVMDSQLKSRFNLKVIGEKEGKPIYQIGD